jgi:ribose 5-phosphate isomerase B
MTSEHEIRDLVRRVVDEIAGHERRSDTGEGAEEIALGADHGGYLLKNKLVSFLQDQGFRVRDCGTQGPESVDYPDYAHKVARLVADGTCRWGVVIDGAGVGSCMVANKVPGVRAALCYDVSSARNSREHNHANVLTLGAGLIGENLARQIVDAWLSTPWGGGRHARRVEKIREVEQRYNVG